MNDNYSVYVVGAFFESQCAFVCPVSFWRNYLLLSLILRTQYSAEQRPKKKPAKIIVSTNNEKNVSEPKLDQTQCAVFIVKRHHHRQISPHTHTRFILVFDVLFELFQRVLSRFLHFFRLDYFDKTRGTGLSTFNSTSVISFSNQFF